MSENTRRLVKAGITLGVVLLLVLLSWVVSQEVMVHKKSVAPPKVEKVEEDKPEEEQSKDTKGFVDDTSIAIEGKVFQKTERMFDSTDSLERQQKFLGENYESLKPALSSIETDYERVFEEIGDVSEAEYDFSSYIDLSKEPINVFSEEFLSSGQTAYNPIGATIVGMYGTHCIVYQMYYNTDFAQPLIAIDYSDMHIDVEQEGLFGYGQNKTFYIDSRYSKLVNYGDYSVLYTRGY